jgi:hypothetical protein
MFSWRLLLNPYVWFFMAAYSALVGGFFGWQGYKYATSLCKTETYKEAIRVANETIDQLTATAKANADIAHDAVIREVKKELENQELQGMIDGLSEEKAALPPGDVCRLSDDDVRRLSDIAKRASGGHADTPATKQPVRPAGSGSPTKK